MLLLTGVPSAEAGQAFVHLPTWELLKLLVANWSTEILAFIFTAFLFFGLLALIMRSRHRQTTEPSQSCQAKAAGAAH